MHKMGPVSTFFMFLIPNGMGMFILSQGISFAMHNKFQFTSHFINLHAVLLAGSGLALMSLSIMLHYVLKRLVALEEKVAEQK